MVSLSLLQTMIFIAVSTVHASTSLLRQPLSLLKHGLETNLLLSPNDYYFLEYSMMIPLAFSQMCLAHYADSCLPRRLIAISLIVSGGSMILFGKIENYHALALMLMISGLFQGLIWPSVCKLLFSWCQDSKLNTFFGLLSTAEYFGNIVANFLGLFLLKKLSWKLLYPPLSTIVVCLSLFAMLSLYLPQELNINVPGRYIHKKITQRPLCKQIWNLPGVSDVSLALCCLKLVKCAIKCWIPDFLIQKLGFSLYKTRIALIVYQVSNISGCIGLGLIARKETILFHCLVLLPAGIVGLMVFWATQSWGYLWNVHMLAIAGFAIGGPSGALSASFAVSLGELEGRKAGGAVVGIITGFGTLGAILERTTISFVIDTYGWNSMFVFLINLLCFSAFLINKAHCVTHAKLIRSRQYII